RVIARSSLFPSTTLFRSYFLGQLLRYALEAGLVGGFIVIGGVGFLLGGVEQAIAAVGLFALAGFRMAPSVIRFQSVLSHLVAIAEYPRHVLAELRDAESGRATISDRASRPLPEEPHRIAFDRVTFRYADDAPAAVS